MYGLFFVTSLVFIVSNFKKKKCVCHLEIQPCPRFCVGEAMIDIQDQMIANYYQRTFTIIIQSNFGGFLHHKDIIQQKQNNIILNHDNDMLNYSKCTLRTVGYH